MYTEVEGVGGCHESAVALTVAARHLSEPRAEHEHHQRIDTFLVYVHKFREVGHGWDCAG